MLATKAALLVLLGLSLSFAHQCTYNSSNGYTYDFSLMRNLGDLTIRSKNARTYYYQVCSEVITNCGFNSGDGVEAAVCIKSQNETHNAGSPEALWQDRSEKEDEGVTIIYSNGEICGTDGSRRKTVVQLQCYLKSDPSFETQNRQVDPYAVASFISSVIEDGCTVRMIVMTPFACPSNKNYTTNCNSRATRDECFMAGQSGDCECAWCNSECVASYQQCDGIREMACFNGSVQSHITVLIFPFLTTLVICMLLTFLCCCVCASRRRNLKKKLDNKLRLPVRSTGYDEVAMEPLMMQPPVMEPQYVYVQYPMPSGQQNPPLYAPNPIFVVPQYTHDMQ
jgi:hypothetical protein